ncbi:MAG: Ig-like domain-containing protein [Gemmatimonadota bacterium]
MTGATLRAVARTVPAILALAACASEGFPPGGPEDRLPPVLVETDPAQRAVNAAPDQAITLTFDEVIDDRQLGELRRLIRVNPDDPEFDLLLEENIVTLAPDEPMIEDLTYTVTVLPGVRDREGNATTEPQSILFSVGGEVPITLSIVRVTILNEEGEPAVGALYRMDNTETEFGYTMTADSQGQVEAEAVAYGPYVATAWIEQVRPEGWQMTEEPGAQDTFELSLLSRAHEATYTIAVLDTTAPLIDEIATPGSRLIRVLIDDRLPEETTLAPGDVRLFAGDPAVEADIPLDSIPVDRQRLRRMEVLGVTAAGASEIQIEPVLPLDRERVYRVELPGVENAGGLRATAEGGLPFRPEYEGPRIFESEPLPWPGPGP